MMNWSGLGNTLLIAQVQTAHHDHPRLEDKLVNEWKAERMARITRRPPEHRKETQTALVSTCLPFVRSGQNHLARHSERGKKKRQTEKEVGRQHQGMDGTGVRQVPESSGEQKKMEEIGCEVICRSPTTLAVER